MASTGVAIDIGTSGIRARSLDLEVKTALSGISTACHPVPGGNLFDHLLYASRFGLASAHRIVVKTVNDLIRNLDLPGAPEVIAVCGNPVQISFLTGRAVRDIRYAPESIRKEPALPHGAMVLDSREIGLDASCDLLVPPAIRAEVGADAVALIRSAEAAGDGPVLATDFGTNSEMALITDGSIFVGSAAAGPALEGQHIRHGMLAAPGAIADLEYDWGWRILVLDDRMELARGDTVDLRTGAILEGGGEGRGDHRRRCRIPDIRRACHRGHGAALDQGSPGGSLAPGRHRLYRKRPRRGRKGDRCHQGGPDGACSPRGHLD